MNFAEDYRCQSQQEIQPAYWSQTQVTIHPVVAYFKKDEKLCHQSYVFISDEPRHNAKFVFALLRSLVPQLIELIPALEYIHYWTDLPMNQYCNKTIFKIISCHTDFILTYPHPETTWRQVMGKVHVTLSEELQKAELILL